MHWSQLERRGCRSEIASVLYSWARCGWCALVCTRTCIWFIEPKRAIVSVACEDTIYRTNFEIISVTPWKRYPKSSLTIFSSKKEKRKRTKERERERTFFEKKYLLRTISFFHTWYLYVCTCVYACVVWKRRGTEKIWGKKKEGKFV